MQYLLEIYNNKNKFLLELLKYFRFVKIHPLTGSNVRFVKELKQSVETVKQAKKGEMKLQKARDLLKEL
jgi:hypothetical protein